MPNFAPKQTFFQDSAVSELARNIRSAFVEIVDTKIVEYDAPYTEPLTVAYDHEPKGVMVLRIRNVSDLAEIPLKTGGTVQFVWDGTRKRCRIDSIDGMTPTQGATYRYTFWMIG